MVTKSPVGLPGLELKHLFTLECQVGTPMIVGDGGMGMHNKRLHQEGPADNSNLTHNFQGRREG